MTQWHVEITCKKSNFLAFLSTVFQEPSCTVIAWPDSHFYMSSLDSKPQLAAEKTSGYYLLSTDFDSCKKVIEVVQRAENILPLLNGVLKLKHVGYLITVGLGAVYIPDEAKRMIKQPRIVILPKKFPRESILQKANKQSPTLVDLWKVAWC